MKTLALLVALLIVAPCAAQKQDPPKDDKKPYVTVFLHSNWSQYPAEAALARSLELDPVRTLLTKVHFNRYSEQTGLFKAGRWQGISESDFPVLMMQDGPTGKVLYVATKKDMPQGSEAIYNELKRGYVLFNALKSQPEVTIEGPLLDRLPFNKPSDGDDTGLFDANFNVETGRTWFDYAVIFLVVGFVLLGFCIVAVLLIPTVAILAKLVLALMKK